MHLQHHLLFCLSGFFCFHVLSMGGVIAPDFCVSAMYWSIHQCKKPLSKFTYMHLKRVWLLSVLFTVGIPTAVPSVAPSMPPTVANFCASQTLTASQADSCSNRLLLVMPRL